MAGGVTEPVDADDESEAPSLRRQDRRAGLLDDRGVAGQRAQP